MFRKHLTVFFVLILAASVFASVSTAFVFLTQNKEAVANLFEEGKLKESQIELINSQLGNAPDTLTGIFSNKKINVYITLDSGEINSYYAETGDKKVNAVYLGERNEADLEVKAKEITIDEIVKSDRPAKALADAIGSGEIEYNGLTAEGKTNSAIVSVGSSIYSFISTIAGFFGIHI